jgi:SAM-dependent methyltransferase
VISLRRSKETYSGLAIAAAPGTHSAAVELIIRHAPDRTSRILDVGCHTGALIRRLHDTGYKNVEGTDLAQKFEEGAFPFTTADLNEPYEHLFNGKKFDVIVASEVVEHLDNPRHFLKGAHRLLSDGGIIIVTTPNVGFFEGRIKFLLKGELWGFGANNYQGQRHISPVTMEQAPLLLDECGFDLTHIGTAGSFATRARRMITAVLWIPMRVFMGSSVLGESLLFVGRQRAASSSDFSSQALWGAVEGQSY